MQQHTTHSAATGDAPRIVMAFLEANTILDVDGMFAVIDSDAVWEFPAAPQGAPRRVQGWQQNRDFFEVLKPMWTDFALTHSVVYAVADDPSLVVAHYKSHGTLLDGSSYDNSYLSLVTVRSGRIVRWIEFCDPAPLIQGIRIMHEHLSTGTTQ
jgi:ketosteroid isomerase-like protein